jgi:hypothetical protein
MAGKAYGNFIFTLYANLVVMTVIYFSCGLLNDLHNKFENLWKEADVA